MAQKAKYRIVSHAGNGRVIAEGCDYRTMLQEIKGMAKIDGNNISRQHASEVICVTKWHGESWEDATIEGDTYYQ